MNGDTPETAAIRKNRWFYGGLLVALLNPIFAGLILGILMLSEPGLKKEGRMVTLFSLIWGALTLALALKYRALSIP